MLYPPYHTEQYDYDPYGARRYYRHPALGASASQRQRTKLPLIRLNRLLTWPGLLRTCQLVACSLILLTLWSLDIFVEENAPTWPMLVAFWTAVYGIVHTCWWLFMMIFNRFLLGTVRIFGSMMLIADFLLTLTFLISALALGYDCALHVATCVEMVITKHKERCMASVFPWQWVVFLVFITGVSFVTTFWWDYQDATEDMMNNQLFSF